MTSKGVTWLPKGDWGFGLMIERENRWDYFSLELSLFKIRFWLYKSFHSDEDTLKTDILGL